jgi:hypothetical protein
MIAIFNLVVLIEILGCTHLARQYIDETFFQCQNFHEYFLVIIFAKYALTLHFSSKKPYMSTYVLCQKKSFSKYHQRSFPGVWLRAGSTYKKLPYRTGPAGWVR